MIALLQLISHEYRKYIFTRGFLLLLMTIPLSFVFFYFAAVITDRAAPVRHFTVIDETGIYGTIIDEALADKRIEDEIRAWDSYARLAVKPDASGDFPLAPPFRPGAITDERKEAFAAAGGQDGAYAAAKPYLKEGITPPPPIRPRFVRAPLPEDATAASTVEGKVGALFPYLHSKQPLENGASLFALVVIPEDFEESREAVFWTNNLIAQDLRGFIDGTLTKALRERAYVEAGVDIALVDRIGRINVDVQAVKADAEGAEDGIVSAIRTGLPLVLAYALFVMINSIGGMLLTNTVEEKSNKIVELLLSSVSATQLMIGKLVGLALVGMTLPALFLLLIFVVITFVSGGEMPAESAELLMAFREGLFGSPIMPLFFLYFLLGYLFYASIYLAVGALSETVQDAQSFVMPLTLMLLIPLPFLQMIVQDPNGLFASIFTFIPLYTPYAVMLRISAQPPVWEMVAATALLLFVVGYVMVTMGRIYRNGVLSAGGAPSWKQLLRLVRS